MTPLVIVIRDPIFTPPRTAAVAVGNVYAVYPKSANVIALVVMAVVCPNVFTRICETTFAPVSALVISPPPSFGWEYGVQSTSAILTHAVPLYAY